MAHKLHDFFIFAPFFLLMTSTSALLSQWKITWRLVMHFAKFVVPQQWGKIQGRLYS